MIQELIDKTLGKSWVVTGADSGQCTAIPHQWSIDLGLPIVYGNAKDTYENAGVDYIKTQDPRVGDIAVFTAQPGNPDGHTGVVTELLADGRFKLLNQNDPYFAKTNIKAYGRAYLKGFLRPKNYNGELNMEELGKLYKIVDQANKNIDKLNKEMSGIYTQVDRLNKQMDGVYKQLDGLRGAQLADGKYEIKKI